MSYEVRTHTRSARKGLIARNIRPRPGQFCLPRPEPGALVDRHRREHIRVMNSTTPPDLSNVIKLATAKKDKRRAEDKFGVPVMKHGYTMLPNLLMEAQGKLKIKHAEFNVLVQLIHHWWDADKDPHPAKDSIARRMGLSPRQVQRVLTKLEKDGLIRRVERFSGRKSQIANGYDLAPLVQKLGLVEPEFTKAKEQRKIRQRKIEGAA